MSRRTVRRRVRRPRSGTWRYTSSATYSPQAAEPSAAMRCAKHSKRRASGTRGVSLSACGTTISMLRRKKVGLAPRSAGTGTRRASTPRIASQNCSERPRRRQPTPNSKKLSPPRRPKGRKRTKRHRRPNGAGIVKRSAGSGLMWFQRWRTSTSPTTPPTMRRTCSTFIAIARERTTRT